MKRCRFSGCRKPFVPFNSLDKCCSRSCAIAYAKEAKPAQLAADWKRAVAVERREDREKLKTRRDYEKEAQRAFNAWIRWRDRFEGCISCHMPAGYRGQWQASHYRSTGAAPELRFDEENVHKSCAQCNGVKSGNVVEYRIRLLAKIGPEAVERLEGPHAPKKYAADDLKAIRKEYSAHLRTEQRRAA